jgi:hypothetical protein
MKLHEFEQVKSELERALKKFPTWPTDPLHALAVIGEEFGELTREVLQFTYEKNKPSNRDTVRAEAVQLAAMTIRFLSSLEEYDYSPGQQHEQSAALICPHGCTHLGDDDCFDPDCPVGVQYPTKEQKQ